MILTAVRMSANQRPPRLCGTRRSEIPQNCSPCRKREASRNAIAGLVPHARTRPMARSTYDRIGARGASKGIISSLACTAGCNPKLAVCFPTFQCGTFKRMETKPPLRFRKVRIAWSVAWGIVAVLVVAFWARSFWWTEILTPRITNDRSALSHGQLYFNADCMWRSFRTRSFYVPGCGDEWMIEEVWAPDANTIEVMQFGFRSPVWPAVVALPLMAAGPWSPRCAVSALACVRCCL